MLKKDWTYDPVTGRTNSSPEYERLVREVEGMIRGGAHSLIAGRADQIARLIVAQLAHVHHLAPSNPVRAKAGRPRIGEPHRGEPWKAEGMSRSTWYRRQAKPT